ncbi:MAG: 4-(cytidine 5'-diphospho)-2-C-methyl-D-erythritol kinase [Rikenellaceae bacterium]
MRIKANCKINIGLDLLARRADGYHELSTVMVPIYGLYDDIEVERVISGVEFRSLGVKIDCADDDNLCVRASRLMQRCYDIGGVSIALDKRVPFGAGLGGGSSDATAVIMAINDLYELNLSESELIARAAEIGSDTPFFVRNTPQLCTSRGEKMEEIDLNLKGYKIALIKPDIHISTREAFSGVRPSVPEVELRRLISMPVAEWQGRVKNDFELHLFKLYPELDRIKCALIDAGAIYASMSGSGSTIYGIFEGDKKIEGEQIASYSPLIYNF